MPLDICNGMLSYSYVPSKAICGSLERSSRWTELSIKTISYSKRWLSNHVIFLHPSNRNDFTPSIRLMRKGDGPNWASTPCCGIMSPQETVGAPFEYPWVCWTGARINSIKTLLMTAAEAQTNAAFPLDGMLKTDLTSVAYLPIAIVLCVCACRLYHSPASSALLIAIFP